MMGVQPVNIIIKAFVASPSADRFTAHILRQQVISRHR
jgi:hypothetical protein